MDKVFTNIKNGYVRILDEKGNYHGDHLNGTDWVDVQVNGDVIMATNKAGDTKIFDKKGNYRGHV